LPLLGGVDAGEPSWPRPHRSELPHRTGSLRQFPPEKSVPDRRVIFMQIKAT